MQDIEIKRLLWLNRNVYVGVGNLYNAKERIMINLRNSVKAIIIENNEILFMQQKAKDSGEIYYILPGGGQSGGETFADALKRECIEELGVEIDVGEIGLIREYIGKNHEFSHKHSYIHQIEYMFFCSLKTPIEMSKATHIDPEQTGYEWINFSEFKNKNVYPKVLKSVFNDKGMIITPIYLGDVN
jgi:8-oxo-dGTP pyrophosphatase MutT (NUDIX family)